MVLAFEGHEGAIGNRNVEEAACGLVGWSNGLIADEKLTLACSRQEPHGE